MVTYPQYFPKIGQSFEQMVDEEGHDNDWEDAVKEEIGFEEEIGEQKVKDCFRT